jgi:hypothetical protein
MVGVLAVCHHANILGVFRNTQMGVRDRFLHEVLVEGDTAFRQFWRDGVHPCSIWTNCVRRWKRGCSGSSLIKKNVIMPMPCGRRVPDRPDEWTDLVQEVDPCLSAHFVAS